MRLICHPDSCDSPVSAVEIEIARERSALTLTYRVGGDIKRLTLPEPVVPARTDGLWRHTCFEAFVQNTGSSKYWEFNLSPSRQWAAYRFDCYREGMVVEPGACDPHIEVQSDGPGFRLSAELDLSGIPALQANDAWRLGLSAVIEDESGGKSWWALAHPPGKPDFHHPDGFVLDLPLRPLR